MTRSISKLYGQFRPESYQLFMAQSGETARVIITGQKVGRPSKRITLHQKGLKVINAKIAALGKDDKNVELARINHLPAREEVRLHTKEMLYPGKYIVEIDYKMPSAGSIQAITPGRECLPCVDEAEAWANAKLEIIQ